MKFTKIRNTILALIYFIVIYTSEKKTFYVEIVFFFFSVLRRMYGRRTMSFATLSFNFKLLTTGINNLSVRLVNLMCVFWKGDLTSNVQSSSVCAARA